MQDSIAILQQTLDIYKRISDVAEQRAKDPNNFENPVSMQSARNK